jgi:hypothetical protein
MLNFFSSKKQLLTVNLAIVPTNMEGMREFGICSVIHVKEPATESEEVVVPA